MEKKGDFLEDLLDASINLGVESLTQSHPEFKNQKQFFINYADRSQLKRYALEKLEDIEKNPSENSRQKSIQKLYGELASYVASGKALKEEGKEVILKKSWQLKSSRPWFRNSKAIELLNSEKYLERTTQAFEQVYLAMTESNIENIMPEFANSVYTLYKNGFMGRTLNILYSQGLLNERKYLSLKEALQSKAKTRDQSVINSIESNVTSKEDFSKDRKKSYSHYATASVILLFFGILILTISNSITGNVIGTTSTNVIPAIIFSVTTLILALFLILRKK